MSYATIAQADTVLTSTEWYSLTDAEKQYALDIGTLWIDEKYSCTATDPVQDSLVTANILLADMKAKGTIYNQKEGSIKSKSSKADVVETSKEYTSGTQQGDNPFAEIELLLGSVCSVLTSMTLSARRV